MLIQAVAFYGFAFMALISALMVITARNSVHSVLFLILTFFSAAGLFLLMGAELLAMLLVIVYVGAVAVLFLFVVMMLDVNFQSLQGGFVKYMPLGILVGFALLAEMGLAFVAWKSGANGADNLRDNMAISPDNLIIPPVSEVTNTEALGLVLYTDYVFIFEVSGLVLLVAMIGAIVLTMRHRPDAKRQNIMSQVTRCKEDVLEIKTVKTGQGI